MNYAASTRVQQCVAELADILNAGGNHVDSADVSKAIRLLRPSKGSVEHVSAIRARIRMAILNNSSHNDAQLELAKFEKQCDAIQKLNPKLLNPFLGILQPLSFAPQNTVTASHLSQPQQKSATDRAFTGDETTVHESQARESMMSLEPPAHVTALKNDASEGVAASESIWVSKTVERALLVDLIYVLQGISGKHIKFDAKTESYVLDPALKLNSTVRDAVLCVCELGWLYGRVAAYLKGVLAAGGDSLGVVVQAFGFALQEELHDYYRLLAVLEQEMQITSKTGILSAAYKDERRLVQRPEDLQSHRRSGETGKTGAEGSAEVEGDAGAPGLTLLRLRAWLQEPIERMCQMARMVDGALPLRGGALVSRLYGHIQHGDPATRSLVRRIMDSVCAPLYTVLSRWVLYGELQDPHKEFFVMLNASASVRNIWRDTYALQYHMLPAYFSHTMAHKILLIGKSINFIRLCLQKLPRVTAKDEQIHADKSDKGEIKGEKGVRKSFRGVNKSKVLGMYGQVHTVGEENEEVPPLDEEVGSVVVEDTSLARMTAAGNKAPVTGQRAKQALNMADVLGSVVTPEVQSALQHLRFGGEATLQDIVYKLSASIDARLLNLVMSRFYVQTHLLALKKFMLLGQGDFVTCLMDGVGPELKRRANQLFRHNLTGILEGALRASNAQFEPSYVLDRIGIRLLEASPGDSGWEIFSLDYAIDAPLNAVVHMDCISKYRIAFHMLWRLKRVEWSLATTWKQHTMFNHANRAHIPAALRAVFHRCYLNRAMMMHVVNNLCAFLMFEVLETSWQSLQETIGRAKCLDDVITAHDAYLTEVLDRALLAPHHEGLNMQVQQLLHIVLRFCTLEENLIADAMAAIARRKVGNTAADERARKQRGNGESPLAAASASLSAPGGFHDGVPEAVVARIDETVKEYSRQFDALMFMLKEQGEKAGEILRFLTFRLDFNGYHQQQREHGASVGLTSTPPAHLKSRPANIFSQSAAPGAAAAGAAAGPGAHAGAGAAAKAYGLSVTQHAADGADRLTFTSTNDGAPSPQRSDSPVYGFSGPEAWDVNVDAGAAGGAAGQTRDKVKPKLGATGSKYLR